MGGGRDIIKEGPTLYPPPTEFRLSILLYSGSIEATTSGYLPCCFFLGIHVVDRLPHLVEAHMLLHDMAAWRLPDFSRCSHCGLKHDTKQKCRSSSSTEY